MTQAIEDRDKLLEQERDNVRHLRQELDASQSTQSALDAMTSHLKVALDKMDLMQNDSLTGLQTSQDETLHKYVVMNKRFFFFHSNSLIKAR
jgi:hypothetical protein